MKDNSLVLKKPFREVDLGKSPSVHLYNIFLDHQKNDQCLLYQETCERPFYVELDNKKKCCFEWSLQIFHKRKKLNHCCWCLQRRWCRRYIYKLLQSKQVQSCCGCIWQRGLRQNLCYLQIQCCFCSNIYTSFRVQQWCIMFVDNVQNKVVKWFCSPWVKSEMVFHYLGNDVRKAVAATEYFSVTLHGVWLMVIVQGLETKKTEGSFFFYWFTHCNLVSWQSYVVPPTGV